MENEQPVNQPLYIPSDSYMPPSSSDAPNVYTTQKFMESVDLRCEDHLTQYNMDVPAKRYCSLCKCLCCDSCVIEFHHDHIDSARIKIDDYFHKKKLELEELKSSIDNQLKLKVNESEIDKIIEMHNKTIGSYFNRRMNTLEEMKTKIEQLIKEENNTKTKMKQCVEAFYKDEGYKRLKTPLEQNTLLLDKIRNFLSDWDALSKTDKVTQLKSGVVDDYLTEGERIKEEIQKVTEEFQGKSDTMKNKINNIFKEMEFPEKVNEFDELISTINKTTLEHQHKIAQLQYDDLIIEQVEGLSQMRKDIGNRLREMQLQQLQQQQQQQQNTGAFKDNNADSFRIISDNNNNNNQGGNNGIGGEFTFVKQQQQQPNVNPFQQQQQQQQQQQSFGQMPQFGNYQQPQQQQPPQPQFQQPQTFTYEYFISFKPRTNEITVFNPELGFKVTTLNSNSFREQKDLFYQVPDHSKYVNIGSSVLLTGGFINKQLSSKCYLICLNKTSTGSFEPIVLPYNPMNEGRERHNIVFLPDKKMVLVASGFFNQSSEYTYIDQGNWIRGGDLTYQRGNATTAYVNNRYVYIIGGYKLNQNQGGAGVYLGDAEYLDTDNISEGWTALSFPEFPLQLSAMGVITLSSNQIILCGGFDGKMYRKESYQLEVQDNMPNKPVLQKSDVMLPGNYIFLHNNFVLSGNNWYNLELSGNAVLYSLFDNKFSLRSPNSGY